MVISLTPDIASKLCLDANLMQTFTQLFLSSRLKGCLNKQAWKKRWRMQDCVLVRQAEWLMLWLKELRCCVPRNIYYGRHENIYYYKSWGANYRVCLKSVGFDIDLTKRVNFLLMTIWTYRGRHTRRNRTTSRIYGVMTSLTCTHSMLPFLLLRSKADISAATSETELPIAIWTAYSNNNNLRSCNFTL